ncbi:MAG: ROK family transcriptional regulator [Treponema sp.]|jgi:predicted NBD/HSP70 family sugar kinase|nr:ROK family transcriptional regulator [Treponema sp.]
MKFPAAEIDGRQYSHQSVVKESNLKQVFDLILEHEGISRIEISKRTGLTRATVSMLVDELATKGLVNLLGHGNSSSAGRKPIMLEINKTRFELISLSLKRDIYICALYDLKGNEIGSFREALVYNKGCGKKIYASITSHFPKLDKKKILAVCACMPARIDSIKKTINLSALKVPKTCDIPAELKSMFPDIPLLAGNQTSAIAYAEYKCVHNGNVDEMIYFNIDEGVAAGILLNGRIFTGEIGHMTIEPGGKLCSCGKRGCVEGLVSKPGLLAQFGHLIKLNRACALHILCGGLTANINYSRIKEAMEKNDHATIRTAERIAEKIAFCISNVICMFNPREIVIGGGIEDLGDTFLKMIIKKVEIPETSSEKFVQNIPIRFTGCAKNAETFGLFRYYLDKFFKISGETENDIYVWN